MCAVCAPQVASNKNLLESLLEKQRRQLEEQMAGCTCAHAARREAELQAQYEKEKLDRVEMMGRQSVRRVSHTEFKPATQPTPAPRGHRPKGHSALTMIPLVQSPSSHASLITKAAAFACYLLPAACFLLPYYVALRTSGR